MSIHTLAAGGPRCRENVMNSSIERLEARLVTDIDRGIVMVTHAIQQVLLRFLNADPRMIPEAKHPFERSKEV
jgi:hypothetical protein